MRCTACNRPLMRATVTILRRGEPLHLGPDCARRSGLTVQAVRKAAAPKPRRRAVMAQAQMDIFEGIEA